MSRLETDFPRPRATRERYQSRMLWNDEVCSPGPAAGAGNTLRDALGRLCGPRIPDGRTSLLGACALNCFSNSAASSWFAAIFSRNLEGEFKRPPILPPYLPSKSLSGLPWASPKPLGFLVPCWIEADSK